MPIPLSGLLHDLINRLGRVYHIPRIQPRHADPPVLRHINMCILPKLQHLLLSQPGETEHANLLGDMFPTALLAVQLLQLLPQHRPHLLDASAHGAQVCFPLGKQRRIVQHGAGNAGAIRGRIADLTALKNGKLRRNTADGVGCIGAWAGDEVEGSGALTVKTEILGKGLSNAQFKPLGDEVADGPSVALQIARREALIGAIKERKVLFFADHLGELGPLRLRKVDAGRIVSTGVQENDAARRGLFDGGAHSGKIETFGVRREVGVGFNGKVHVGEDLVVVGPCGGREIGSLVRRARIEPGKE